MSKITAANIRNYTKTFDELCYFALNKTSMSDDDIQALLEILRDRNDIVALEFDNCQITDAQIEMILNSLSDNKISELTFVRNPITTRSANAIANVLRNKHIPLKKLNFLDNDMSNGSAKIIAEALNENIHLTSLRVSNNDTLTNEVQDVFYQVSKINSRARFSLPSAVDFDGRIYYAYDVHGRVIEKTNQLYAVLLAVEQKEARTTPNSIKASVAALEAIKTELDAEKYKTNTIIYKRLESAIIFLQGLGALREGKIKEALQIFRVIKPYDGYYLDIIDELIAMSNMHPFYLQDCESVLIQWDIDNPIVSMNTNHPAILQVRHLFMAKKDAAKNRIDAFFQMTYSFRPQNVYFEFELETLIQAGLNFDIYHEQRDVIKDITTCIKKLEELRLGTFNLKMIQKISSGIILLEAQKNIIAGDVDIALAKAASIQETDPNFCIAQQFILELAKKFISIRHIPENETPQQHLERLECCQKILGHIKTDNALVLNTDIPIHTQNLCLIVADSHSKIETQLSEEHAFTTQFTKI